MTRAERLADEGLQRSAEGSIAAVPSHGDRMLTAASRTITAPQRIVASFAQLVAVYLDSLLNNC